MSTPPKIQFHPDEDPTAIDIRFDPRAHMMHGTTMHGNINFDVPYLSHIHGNLYMGGTQSGLVLPKFITNLVSLYPWEQYTLHGGVESVLTQKWYDGPIEQVLPALEPVVDWACSRISRGPLALVCQAGLNRSGLVSALVLMKEYRFSGKEAVALLREKRSPAVLCNEQFEQYVLQKHLPHLKKV